MILSTCTRNINRLSRKLRSFTRNYESEWLWMASYIFVTSLKVPRFKDIWTTKECFATKLRVRVIILLKHFYTTFLHTHFWDNLDHYFHVFKFEERLYILYISFDWNILRVFDEEFVQNFHSKDQQRAV